jgi:hypothetical protein
MSKESKIQLLEKEIQVINKRIKSIVIHDTLETMNEVSELYKRKKQLELEKFDLENGTHRLEISRLDKKVTKLSFNLQDDIDRYNESKKTNNPYDIKKARRQAEKSSLKIKRLQALIISLEDLDDRILMKKDAHIL